MRLHKLIFTLVFAVANLLAIPSFATEQYPTGTAIVIKNADSIEVRSDNPGLHEINGTAITFNRPGVANLEIIAKYGNNSAMLFKKSVKIIPNKGLNGIQIFFNPVRNSFQTKTAAQNESVDAEYLPIDFGGNRTLSKANQGQGRELVPIEQLDNKSLLHWNLTDEQYRMCYEAAVQFAKPLAHLTSRKEIIKELGISLRKYTDSSISYSTEAPHFLDAYGFFITRQASCQGETCATGFCLNILGIEYEHVNHNKWKHQWCRVKVEDGSYWICDAYGLYCGPEPAPYKHPKFE